MHEVARDGHEAQLAVADECEDSVTHGRWIKVGFNSLHGIEHRCSALINMAVGFCNVIDLLLGVTVFAKYYGIDTEVRSGIVGHNNEGRNIAGDTASPFYEHPITNARVFMQHNGG